MKNFLSMAKTFWTEPAGVAAVCRCLAGFLLSASMFFSWGMKFLQNIAAFSPLFLLLLIFFCKNNCTRAIVIIFTVIMMIIFSGFSWQLPVLTVVLWVLFTAAGAIYCGFIFKTTARWTEFIAAILLILLGVALIIKAFKAPLGNEELLFGMIFGATSLFSAGRILSIWHRKFARGKIS